MSSAHTMNTTATMLLGPLAALVIAPVLIAWHRVSDQKDRPTKPKQPLMISCSCQHECHLDRHALSPKGQPAHAYQMKFPLEALVGPKEALFCLACANDCRHGKPVART